MENINENVLCEIIREDENYYLIDIATGERSEAIRTKDFGEDGILLLLPKNAANRKYVSEKKLVETLNKGERYLMVYKETKHIGAVAKMPNEKLLAYLTEDEQNELKDIFAKAVERRNADKPAAMTPADKLRAKIAKLQSQLEGLTTDAE